MITQHLRCELLGDFRLAYDSQPLTGITSARLQSLLAYLLLHRDAPQSRQHLAFTLYPDSTESQARTNLRNLLHLLRHALPDAGCFVASDTLTLQWRADAPFTLDVSEFQQLVDHSPPTADPTSLHRLSAAVKLYRGDLLPSCYDDWILPEREQLRQAYVRALESLVQLCVEQQDYGAADGHAQLLLRYDPVREETYRTLMQLAAWRGDRAGVVRFYNTCVTVLRRELDTEPSAETQSDFAQLSRQLSKPATPGALSPPRARHHNLPLHLDRFVGREREKEQVAQQLRQHRLVTLVGAGGVGKTRLAVATAASFVLGGSSAHETMNRDSNPFGDGIWLVDLTPLPDPSLLPQTVASVLGVRETSGRPILDTVMDCLHGRHMLLILDNCEHLIEEACQFAETVLTAAPFVRILATSRQVLGIAGERIFRVPPLRVPDLSGREAEQESAELSLYDSVQLFTDRAQLALPTFVLTPDNAKAVARICHRVDGIPLALELAAARIKLLTPQPIAQGLDDAFHLLTRGNGSAFAHHQTMRATMDWSHETLSDAERTLLRRLSVFAGGFTVEASEAVCGDDGREHGNSLPRAAILDVLSDLTDKSLVTLDPRDGATRLSLLELVRQYGREKLLESGEALWVSARHLEYFRGLAETAEPELCGSQQKAWLAKLELDHDNLRAALKWSFEHSDAATSPQCWAERGSALTAAMWQFWYQHGYLTEGEKWLNQALDNCDFATCAVRAKLLTGSGSIAFSHGNYLVASAQHEQALALYRELADPAGSAFALNNLGLALVYRGYYSRARVLLEESLSLYRQADNKWGLAVVLGNLGSGEALQGHLEESINLFEEGLVFARVAGDSRLVAFGLHNLGDVARYHGDYARARMLLEESLTLTRDLGEKSITALNLNILGLSAIGEGNLQQAETLLKASLELGRELGEKRVILQCLEGFAWIASKCQNHARAARLFAANESLRDLIGLPLPVADQSEHNRYLSMTRAQLDPVTLDVTWAKGLTTTMDQAVTVALKA